MSPAKSAKPAPDKQPAPLKAEIRLLKPSRDGLAIHLRLTNASPRALHYIGDVRAIRFDAATGQLEARLTDTGRQRPPEGAQINPQFRFLDPNSVGELVLELPALLSRLTPNGGKIGFETFDTRDARRVSVTLGWADTPFYDDPRDQDSEVLPTAKWEQGSLTASADLPPHDPLDTPPKP